MLVAQLLKQCCFASKRSIAVSDLSGVQQIQGGQQIDAEMINGISVSHAKARSSQRFRAIMRAMLNLFFMP